MIKNDYVAFLHKDNVPIEKHIIRMPTYGEKGWYKNVVSIDAFKDREAKRFYDTIYVKKVPMFGLHCSLWRLEDWIRHNQITAESMLEIVGIVDYQDPYDILPTFEHESVFDFYKAVGYDYKKKRYI